MKTLTFKHIEEACRRSEFKIGDSNFTTVKGIFATEKCLAVESIASWVFREGSNRKDCLRIHAIETQKRFELVKEFIGLLDEVLKEEALNETLEEMEEEAHRESLPFKAKQKEQDE